MSVSNGAPASPQGAATPPFCLQGSRGARIAGWDCAPSAAAAPPPHHPPRHYGGLQTAPRSCPQAPFLTLPPPSSPYPARRNSAPAPSLPLRRRRGHAQLRGSPRMRHRPPSRKMAALPGPPLKGLPVKRKGARREGRPPARVATAHTESHRGEGGRKGGKEGGGLAESRRWPDARHRTLSEGRVGCETSASVKRVVGVTVRRSRLGVTLRSSFATKERPGLLGHCKPRRTRCCTSPLLCSCGETN